MWSVLLLAKTILALNMPLFGDEAFYAWEALHPAWAYSDLPGATAAAIGLGTHLVGDSTFGVRLVFLVAGALLPFLVVRIAARLGTRSQAWRAGAWSLPLPLLVPMGFMALPDALLTLAALMAVDAAVGLLASKDESPAPLLHGQFAFALALGALAHYRFAPILVVGALALLACGDRRVWRRPGLWIAVAVGAAAWWPVLAYNLEASGVGVQFQLVERHPWAFDAKGLLQPVLQSILVTPLLYVLSAWALWTAARSSGDSPRRFVALAGGGLWVFYALLAPFVDKARFSMHWPIPAYLLAAILLPMALDAARSAWPVRLAPWAAGLAGSATLLMLAVFSIPASHHLAERTAGTALYPDNFVGWQDVSDALRPRLQAGDVVVADHFMLAAQLSFALDRREAVFVLDHWNNHKHGRAPQIEAWGYGEAALGGLEAGAAAWIVFEAGETPIRDQAAWVRRPCRWFERLEHVETVRGPGGGKTFWIYRGVRSSPEGGDRACGVAPPQS